jgi:Putative beta barrel porin-7 (BBP7)
MFSSFRSLFMGIGLSLALAPSFIHAQQPDFLKVSNAPPKAKQSPEQPIFRRGSNFDGCSQPCIKVWGSAEYLLWWSKNAPLHTPLVTTGSPTDPVPAALGQPGTKVLFGEHSIDNGGRSGFRVALRSWLGDEDAFGIEGTGFYLPEKSRHNFSASGTPSEILAVPFFNTASVPPHLGSGGWNVFNSGESALFAAGPALDDQGPVSGSISVNSSTQLWDVELNGLFNFLCESHFSLNALAGALYVDLQDSLNLNFFSQLALFPSRIFEDVTITDHFHTHNLA